MMKVEQLEFCDWISKNQNVCLFGHVRQLNVDEPMAEQQDANYGSFRVFRAELNILHLSRIVMHNIRRIGLFGV